MRSVARVDASKNIRLIIDPPLAGAVNMARDEALMVGVGRGQSPPTLRFYRWDPPTISLGYFQHYDDYQHLAPPAGALAVVRRLTGGGAILHDRELTYSLVLATADPMLSSGPNRLYEVAHDAVIEAASAAGITARRGGESDGSGAARGPFFCFARRHVHDVLIGSDKFAGSAQRRTRTAVLQHGSIILDARFDQQPAVSLGLPNDDEGIQPWVDRLTEALGLRISRAIRPGDWSDQERAAADELTAKYAGTEWTGRT